MLPTTYISVILLSLLLVVTTLIGVGLALCFKKSNKGIAIGIGFSLIVYFGLSLIF